MINWVPLRKTGALLHLSYGGTFTNNLYGEDFRVRVLPEIELSFDLGSNLRARIRGNEYDDAQELLDGGIDELKLVQIDDEQVLKKLGSALRRTSARDGTWKLTIHLAKEHHFTVRPELQPQLLLLRVAPNP